MFRAESDHQEVLAYAEYNRTCFKVVAATSRDVSRDIDISLGVVHVSS